jgi:hypothetical protein
MTSEAENKFREAERQLDLLFREAEPVIAARGISVADDSARSYHYKNEYLSWRYRFETRQPRGSEIAKVWVVVSLDECNLTVLKVWRRAEIFQPGQLSRWESTTEEQVPLDTAMQGGLSSIIVEAIQAGEVAATNAA